MNIVFYLINCNKIENKIVNKIENGLVNKIDPEFVNKVENG